jgi:hypothetical protein
MREPQVVRMPAVARMSLCAIGMPISGPSSPLPIAPSAARASASARSASTVMNALSFPSSARYARDAPA